jgi:hypothetical protein
MHPEAGENVLNQLPPISEEEAGPPGPPVPPGPPPPPPRAKTGPLRPPLIRTRVSKAKAIAKPAAKPPPPPVPTVPKLPTSAQVLPVLPGRGAGAAGVPGRFPETRQTGIESVVREAQALNRGGYRNPQGEVSLPANITINNNV